MHLGRGLRRGLLPPVNLMPRRAARPQAEKRRRDELRLAREEEEAREYRRSHRFKVRCAAL